ncbi:Protein XAP5 CIRCADIAN TIMEKEEPER [Platanthera guangdongensis]|uniref:Protein XAP5 CIRCADIAN TIMEKEEPER n=1 Tax=Platanthera guangdongensis TaxID=2320717 RepID=A0ABR2MPX6_9ASPA
MSGMGDGYVGTAQDAVRIRRLEKQREAERRKIQELKSKSASNGGQTGLLQFGSGTSEIKRCLVMESLERTPLWRLAFYQIGQSFSEREAEEQAERERLCKQWLHEQEIVRNETLEITYSYWDGAGHRRVIQVRKGDTIGEFLRAVQQQLATEFREIRTTSVENLVYVKEDLIIPHQYSFYELIVNKARGKSGPLFHFDVHEDVRTVADATIEKDESHAGKVVERHWYEKNKHIFPASRWEIYDPTQKWERYTIHGD